MHQKIMNQSSLIDMRRQSGSIFLVYKNYKKNTFKFSILQSSKRDSFIASKVISCRPCMRVSGTRVFA